MLDHLTNRIFGTKYQTLNLIKVNKKALINNFRYFQKINGHKLVAPVLKSNAYGHGLVKVARLIDEHLVPPFITVDSLYEAYELRKAKIKTGPLIIGYTKPENFKIGPKIDYSIPVYDFKTAAVINRHQPRAKVHLKIDTGMNRLGIQPDQARDFARKLKKLKKLNVTGIYSHLSQATNLNKKFTLKQIKTFKSVIRIFEQEGFQFKWKHISASAGSVIGDDPEFNLVRIGLGFYGLSPFPTNTPKDKKLKNKLQPALKLTSHIAQTKIISKNSEVGYGGTYKTKSKTKIGILPLGYYEGVDRRLSNKGFVKIKNNFCPIIGNICMNLTIIDLSPIPDAEIGTKVTVYSDKQNDLNNIDNSAKTAKTIPYVILVNLADSIRRELN
jgi:alanine racemase